MKVGNGVFVRMGVLGLVVVLLGGCLAVPVALTDSTKPLTPGTYTEVGEVDGTAYSVMLLFIPLSEPNPAAKARDRAIANGNADALVNVAMSAYQFTFPFVTLIVTHCSGTAVKENK